MPEPMVPIRRQIPLLAILLLAGTSHIASAQNPDLTYHPVTPCTVVDTRSGTPFAAGEIRTYNVVGSASLASQGGSATGCGIPGFSNGIAQVQAVALVFTAITPAGVGNIAAHAADQPLAGSVLNLVAGTTPTNTTPVAVAQTTGVGDIKVQVSFSSTHVLIRAVGYYSKDVQTVHVHPVPGDHTASGTALLNALAGITNASSTKRYVIKVEPGIFELGSNRLIMKPYVDIEGSGQEATVIQGGGFSTNDDGVVWGAASAELRELQVRSASHPSQAAIAFYLPSGDTRLRNVSLFAIGGVGTWGIRSVGDPFIEECTIRAQGGANSHGFVSLGENRRPVIKRTGIEVTNGSSNGYGMLFLSGSAPAEIRDVQIEVSGSYSFSYGIYLDDPFNLLPSRVTSSTIDVGGANTNTGIWFRGLQLNVEQSQIRTTGSNSTGIVNTGSGTFVLEHSESAGASNSAVTYVGPLLIGASRLEGGAVVGSTLATCAGVYDETFAFYAGPACP